MEDALNKKYAKATLLNLYHLGGTAMKSDLLNSTSGWYALNQVLSNLQNDGYIQVIEHIVGRRTYEIKITEKGIAAAQKLEELNDISEGLIHFDGEDINVSLTPEERENSQYLKFLFHFNVMDNHVTVEEAVPGRQKRIFNIYLKQNCHGDFRLWCEQDDSYECWHVRQAWGYPEVQQMMLHFRGKVKVCQVCHYENPENALFCMHCGNKL